MLNNKIKKKLHQIFPSIFKDPSIKSVAEKYGIKTWQIKNLNNKEFVEEFKNWMSI